MQMIDHITSLLYTHNCVIVPGLGGFITKRKQAEADLINHTASPAAQHLAFNAQLNENDGLLIHRIMKHDVCDHQTAENAISSFVAELRSKLAEGGHATVKPLGTFYQGDDNKLIFVPSLKQNYEIRSYGLPTLKLKKPIQAPASIEVIENEPRVKSTPAPLTPTHTHTQPPVPPTPTHSPAPLTQTEPQTLSKEILVKERKENKQLEEVSQKRSSFAKGLNVINVLGSVFLVAMFFTLFNFEFGDGSIYEMVDNKAQIFSGSTNSSEGDNSSSIQKKDLNTLLEDYQNDLKTIYYEILLDGTYSKSEVENIQLEISDKYPQSKIIEVENNEYSVSVISFMNEDLAKQYRDLIQKNFQYELIIKSK